MPYIKPESRTSPIGRAALNAGELNYRIFKELLAYLQTHTESYTVYNEIMGVLSCVQAEFYRRCVVPYEEKKMLENGDIL